MHFDDFIAQQILNTTHSPSTQHRDARQPIRRLLHTLRNYAHQLASGIDASSSIQHGINLPANHGARRQP